MLSVILHLSSRCPADLRPRPRMSARFGEAHRRPRRRRREAGCRGPLHRFALVRKTRRASPLLAACSCSHSRRHPMSEHLLPGSLPGVASRERLGRPRPAARSGLDACRRAAHGRRRSPCSIISSGAATEDDHICSRPRARHPNLLRGFQSACHHRSPRRRRPLPLTPHPRGQTVVWHGQTEGGGRKTPRAVLLH